MIKTSSVVNSRSFRHFIISVWIFFLKIFLIYHLLLLRVELLNKTKTILSKENKFEAIISVQIKEIELKPRFKLIQPKYKDIKDFHLRRIE